MDLIAGGINPQLEFIIANDRLLLLQLALFKESTLPNAEQRFLLICNWTLTPPHSFPDAKYWNSTFTIAEEVSDVITLEIPRCEMGWWLGVHFRTLRTWSVQKNIRPQPDPTPLVLWVKTGREICTRRIQSLSYNSEWGAANITSQIFLFAKSEPF